MQNYLWVFPTNHLDSNDNQVTTENLSNSYKNTTNEHITEPNEYKAWFRWFLCQPTRKWISLHSIRGRLHFIQIYIQCYITQYVWGL